MSRSFKAVDEGVTVRAVVETRFLFDQKVDLFKFERSNRLLFFNKNKKIVHATQMSNFVRVG